MTLPAGARPPLRREGAPPLRTVFLDLGDTLMYIHPDVPALYLSTCRDDLGLDVDAVDVERALKAGERMYRDAIRAGRAFESSMPEATRFWQEYNEHILGELRVAAGPRRAVMARELSERFWHPRTWRVFPEVAEVLARLHGAGLRLCVVSNFTEAIHALLRTHELDAYLDGIVASVNTGSQKPDVSIFREALRRSDADPAASVMVGDNYVADVLGARAVGLEGILVDRTRHGGRGMFDFALRDGIGGTAGVRLDCPVIGDLTGLYALLA